MRDSGTGVFLWILRSFYKYLFSRTPLMVAASECFEAIIKGYSWIWRVDVHPSWRSESLLMMVSVTDVSLELFKKRHAFALWNSTRTEIFPTFKRSKKRQTNSPGNSSLFFTLFFPQLGQVLLSLFKAKSFFFL